MNDEELERRLRDEALRPADAAFTRRVLGALPPRAADGLRGSLARALLMTSRLAFALMLIAAAQRWFMASPGKDVSVLVFLLVSVPAIAALSQLYGGLVPRSAWQSVRRMARHWR